MRPRISEAALVVGLGGLLLWKLPRQDRAVVLALLVAHLPHLVLFFG